jgi:hypothetical protein
MLLLLLLLLFLLLLLAWLRLRRYAHTFLQPSIGTDLPVTTLLNDALATITKGVC